MSKYYLISYIDRSKAGISYKNCVWRGAFFKWFEYMSLKKEMREENRHFTFLSKTEISEKEFAIFENTLKNLKKKVLSL